MSRNLLLPLMLVLVLGLGLLGCVGVRSHQEPAGPHFSLLTWNINRASRDPAEAIDVIREADADVVILQESTPFWETALAGTAEQSYPHVTFRHFDRGGGLAVLSRYPFAEAAYVPSPAGKYPGWVLDVETPVGRTQVLVVHLHAPVNAKGDFTIAALLTRGDDRLAEIEVYMGRLDPQATTIVAGDFNECRSGKAVRYLSELGYTNALDEFDRWSHTWSLLGPLPLVTNRTDHVLYSPALYCYSCRVTNAGDSDHRPVYAVFGKAPGDTMAAMDMQVACITPDEAKTRREENPGDVVLLDCREPAELEIAAIAGAVHIPMGEIPTRRAELEPGKELIVFCHSGVRSLQVTAYLRQQGFSSVKSMTGGIDAWSRVVDPAVPRY